MLYQRSNQRRRQYNTHKYVRQPNSARSQQCAVNYAHAHYDYDDSIEDNFDHNNGDYEAPRFNSKKRKRIDRYSTSNKKLRGDSVHINLHEGILFPNEKKQPHLFQVCYNILCISN